MYLLILYCFIGLCGYVQRAKTSFWAAIQLLSMQSIPLTWRLAQGSVQKISRATRPGQRPIKQIAK